MGGGKGKGKGSTGGKGKGKGSTGGKGGNASCPDPMPSAEDILAELSDKFAAEICMFTSMGWIDTDKVADQGQITGDIMTLPNEISEALTGDDFTTCVEQFEADAMDYVANIMCFKSVFEESCGLYMSNTMASMAG